jgi:hypothetical protein
MYPARVRLTRCCAANFRRLAHTRHSRAACRSPAFGWKKAFIDEDILTRDELENEPLLHEILPRGRAHYRRHGTARGNPRCCSTSPQHRSEAGGCAGGCRLRHRILDRQFAAPLALARARLVASDRAEFVDNPAWAYNGQDRATSPSRSNSNKFKGERGEQPIRSVDASQFLQDRLEPIAYRNLRNTKFFCRSFRIETLRDARG